MENKYTTTTIKKIEKENERLKTFILDCKVRAKPGQYLMVWLPGLNEKPFGVVDDNPLTLTVAKVGPFSSQIHELKVGDKITFRGPYGSHFNPKGTKIIFVGGGYGVVPLYFFAKTLPKIKRKKATVVIGARTKSDLPYVKKFEKLGCQVLVATDDGSTGFKGFTTELVGELLKKEKFDSLYTAGPEIMMEKLAAICRREKIYCEVSIARPFKCGGLGLCGECAFKGHLVCQEGPVFNGKIFFE